MRFRPVLTLLGIIGLCALAIAYAVTTPDARGVTAPVTEFSAERAMAHVRQLAQAPRPAGSDAHRDAMVYIMARIAALGVEPRIQGTTGIGTRYPVAGRVRNVLARIPGTRPATRQGGGAVLLVAHYDGVAAGPAAGDDASGVSVLLETLRAIRQGPLLANDIIALFTDSEEVGLLGAAAFAREHAWTADVGVILNFEARGTHGPSLMFETGPANHDVIRFLRSVPGARATSLSTAVYRQLPNDTDLSELAVLGRPAMNFGFIAGVERYHTSEDDVAHLSAESIQHHGTQALALTRAFGNAQLPRPREAGGGNGDAVFFDLPLVGIVLYPESWALPFAVLALVAAIVALVLSARRETTAWLASGLGVVTLVVSVVAAALLAGGAAWLFAWLHESLPWGGTPQWRGIYALAIALLTIAIVTAVMGAARRVSRERTRALECGAIVALGALALYVTVVMPGVSFLFTWPVFAAAAAGIVAILSPPFVAGIVRWIATALIVCLLVPTVYLMVCLALGLDLTGAAVLAILTTFGVWLLASHIPPGTSSSSRVPLGASVAALVAIAIGVFTVRTDAARPAGSMFIYAADSASAWLTGGATNGWARAWIQRELTSRADSLRDVIPSWLTPSIGSRPIVPAPMVAVAAPSARIVADTMVGNERIVTVRILARGARSVQVSAETGIVARARVDDREISSDRYRARSRRWSLDYAAPSDSGFTLMLTLNSGTEHVLSLVARYPGFPSGVQVPARPRGIIPIASGDATHVYRMVALR